MKQLLFLLLFPSLALAQYQGNASQKITLGEQTTADGLVFRGVASIDTVTATSKITRANKQDTSAYLLLDTVTNLLWHYKIGSNAWTQAGGGDTSLIAYVNTYGTQTVNGAKTFTSAVTGASFIPTSSTIPTNGMYLSATNTLGFSTNSTNKMTLDASGNLMVGTTSAAGKLHVYGSNPFARISNSVTGDGGIKISYGNEDTHGLHLTYNPGSALSYIDNTYPVSSFQIYGDIYFRQNVGGTMTTRMAIKADGGNVGIGTISPAVQFHTTGGVRFATFAGGGTTTLSVDNNGDLARTSSFELKKDITPINYGLNEILQINPINFNWIDGDKFGNENENGFIAEDVMNVIPNVVGSDAHGLFMDYTKLIPILTKAIQEQQALIKALEQRIINLENK